MPKKPTKTREHNLAGKVVAGEGAPPPSAFSLADFMTALPTKNSSQEKVSAASKEQDFPALGASHPQSQGSNPTFSAWTHPPATAPTQTTKPSSEEKVSPAPVSSTSPCPASAYSVGKTKKGGLPVRVESRSKGKKVTVVFNVTGDLKLLLSELKQAAGSGGVVREDTIEIQGDKLQFVENFISKKIKKK